MSWRTPVTRRQHTGAWATPGQSERVAEHTMAGKVVVKTNMSDECVSVLARVCLCVCLCLRRAPCLCYFRRCPCMYTSLCVSASSHVIVFVCVHHVTSRKQAETHMTDGIALTTKMQGSNELRKHGLWPDCACGKPRNSTASGRAPSRESNRRNCKMWKTPSWFGTTASAKASRCSAFPVANP